MPNYPRSRKSYAPKRKQVIPKSTQRIRQLSGQAPLTRMERFASYAGKAGQIASQVAVMAGLINSEVKFIDQSLSGTIDNTGTYLGTPLNGVAEGDDYTQRNGRSVLSKNLQIKASVIIPSSGAPSTCGWALIMDKKPTGVAPTWSSVFQILDQDSPINKVNSERFIILKRGTMTFNTTMLVKTIQIYVNLKGIHIKYDGTGATAIDQNSIYLIAYSPKGIGSQPIVTGYSRFNFYDN